MTDCRPISLFSIQTGRQLGDEIGTVLDKRRFRANIYMDLASTGGFAEDLIGFHARPLPEIPDQSTTLRVDSSSTDDSRLRGALPQGDICSAAKLFFDHLVGAGEHRGREGYA